MSRTMPQAAPACNTCLDLRYWERSHPSIEALDRLSDHDGSTKTVRVSFEPDTIQLSATRCQLCAILLEGLVRFLGPQGMESCYHIELTVGLPSTIRLDITYYDTSYKQRAIEFYTTQEVSQTLKPLMPFPRGYHVRPTMNSCSNREKPVLPKRVVRLASYNMSPVLYETSHGERADYVALSYCWGGEKHLLTTQNTIRSHKAGIPWSQIPQTLKDAMQLTLELGVEFIWIDALCIIQDDPVDWMEEASKFGSVYRDALITVSVTASPNTTSGIFCGERSHRHNLRTHVASMENIDIYMRQACSTTYVGLFEHLNIFGNGYQEEEVLPILGRGWTFQERILSRRLLHCSSEELAWECVHGHLRSIPDTKKVVEGRLRNGVSEAWDRTNSPLREWQELTVAYSSCQFTYSRDRLVALEGIAQKFQQFGLGPYFYDLPTWSWASVYHKCHYNYHHFSPSYQSISVCDILRSPSGVAPDSDFSSRALVISSKIVDATIRLQEGYSGIPLDVEVIIDGKIYNMIADIKQWPESSNEWENIQEDERLYNGQAVLCLELSTYQLLGRSQSVKVFLVLRESPEAHDRYRRVGIMVVSESWKPGVGDVPAQIQHIDQHANKRTLEIV
ncbi:hypothetical protein G4B84_004207 [Aspergillus flavus NRRL3357]|nr:uncharacterized protein G4B84_004207 [Aspergillus flavus NRRL3357]QMW28872.1 hypothetical protein G4B84_004207 [Aspergillus flavus NRRL3357]QMW40947.1 hypothetical protein G4B11_004271 [Aspergillus flavus]